MKYVKTGEHLLPIDRIESADYSRIEDLILVVNVDGRSITIEGIDALESAMVLRPSCLEGKRLRWAKHKWMIHNLFGHPAMQILAMLGLYDLAFRVHDATVPKPLGRR
jgi:hypothetical protein